jgi:hypothetical protein
MEFELDEKIGITRIRLSLPVCGLTVVVADFCAAERALSAWRQASRPVHRYEYAIQFTDGAALRGQFALSAETPKTLSLRRVIRIALGKGSVATGLRVDHALIDRNGCPVEDELLVHYQLEGI